jgi:hypothetical protein
MVSMNAPQSTPSDDVPAYGPELQCFAYPWPVLNFEFVSQGIALHMAYMDVRPKTPNGRVVILLHGKNSVAARCLLLQNSTRNTCRCSSRKISSRAASRKLKTGRRSSTVDSGAAAPPYP